MSLVLSSRIVTDCVCYLFTQIIQNLIFDKPQRHTKHFRSHGFMVFLCCLEIAMYKLLLREGTIFVSQEKVIIFGAFTRLDSYSLHIVYDCPV